MRFAIGNRVKFSAVYKDNGKPYDPKRPTADVTMGDEDKTMTPANGGLARLGVGMYTATFTVTSGPMVTIRFSDGDEMFSESSFGVDVPLAVQADPNPGFAEAARADDAAARVAALRAKVRSDLEADPETAAEFSRMQQANAARIRDAWSKKS